ncbi:MAG TPA: hypothetical protein VHC43_02755 [Mycobacteriales bacterium]|nr:hypothetical protein [Mycobacteriales bacterium]
MPGSEQKKEVPTMSGYTISTSAPTPATTWVSPTSTCATGAVFGMSQWMDQLAIAPNAAAAKRNRKHGRGARASGDPV